MTPPSWRFGPHGRRDGRPGAKRLAVDLFVEAGLPARQAFVSWWLDGGDGPATDARFFVAGRIHTSELDRARLSVFDPELACRLDGLADREVLAGSWAFGDPEVLQQWFEVGLSPVECELLGRVVATVAPDALVDVAAVGWTAGGGWFWRSPARLTVLFGPDDLLALVGAHAPAAVACVSLLKDVHGRLVERFCRQLA